MNFAIILAGGVGTRMGISNLPKQYVEINGKPVLVYTMEKMEACESVDRIVVVADQVWQDQIKSWCETYGIRKFSGFAEPGVTRQESVFSGLLICEQQQTGPEDIVVIHDAARPLVSPQLVASSIEAAKQYGCALSFITAKDTIYSSTDGKFITGLLDRSTLMCGQTPETFNLKLCLDLNRKATQQELQIFHGCSELAFHHGLSVRLIPGEEMNFKLTTLEDLDRLYTVLGIPPEHH